FGSLELKKERTKRKLPMNIASYVRCILLFYEIFHKKVLENRRFTPLYLLKHITHHPLYDKWVSLILVYPCKQWSYKLFLQCLVQSKQIEHIEIKIQLQKWLEKIYRLTEKKMLHLRRFEKLLPKKLDNFEQKSKLKKILDCLDYFLEI